MGLFIREYRDTDSLKWDSYVRSHPKGTLYHLSGWRRVIQATYGHRPFYLMAVQDNRPSPSSQYDPDHQLSPMSYELTTVGILPLFHLKHFLFGNSLISIPFFDIGGILADHREAEGALLSRAIEIGRELDVKSIEFRNLDPFSNLDEIAPCNATNLIDPITLVTKSHKVRMLLGLPPTSDLLMNSFKSKLRSQIKKPMKDGLGAVAGGADLLDDFYRVFLINMRDLGSPVHSKSLMRNVLSEFAEEAKVVVVYNNKQALACSMMVGFKDTLENPWDARY